MALVDIVTRQIILHDTSSSIHHDNVTIYIIETKIKSLGVSQFEIWRKPRIFLATNLKFQLAVLTE